MKTKGMDTLPFGFGLETNSMVYFPFGILIKVWPIILQRSRSPFNNVLSFILYIYFLRISYFLLS